MLGDKIGDLQSSFLKGRRILDAIAALEVIQFSKRNNMHGYLLNLGFEKAYDMIEWECIVESLQASGFSQKWVFWIYIWPRSAKVSIIPNGVQDREITCKRSLRQGDPLSP